MKMTDEQLAVIAKPGLFEAVQAMFAMEKAIRENELTIDDLAAGLSVAIDKSRGNDSGHDMALICMSMMTIAINQDKAAATP
jgi:hypothetical protein